jgi:hypothetical protein
MSAPITTTGTTPNPVSTQHINGESAHDWVVRHDDAVAASTTTGDKLTTTWKSASGNKTVSTTRDPDELPGTFLLRHIDAYLVVMENSPPIP